MFCSFRKWPRLISSSSNRFVSDRLILFKSKNWKLDNLKRLRVPLNVAFVPKVFDFNLGLTALMPMMIHLPFSFVLLEVIVLVPWHQSRFQIGLASKSRFDPNKFQKSKAEIWRQFVVVLSLSFKLMVLTMILAFVSFFVFKKLEELCPVALP